MNLKLPYSTDQTLCYDTDGKIIPCEGTGQDGEVRKGRPWPDSRFLQRNRWVIDQLTGLMWTQDAALGEFPITWQEAQDALAAMNAEKKFGFSDWRLPLREELFSILSHARINPALPLGHPFISVFSGYYWTATQCARFPNQAWYVHLGGGRVFTGMKHGSYMVWPVRNYIQNPKMKMTSTQPRFRAKGVCALDTITGLSWLLNMEAFPAPTTWEAALASIKSLNKKRAFGFGDWRLPNIRELESLVNTRAHSPALALNHPFENVQPAFWSSTTSVYEPAYAWTLYMQDGRVGVGFKKKTDFHVWPVR